MLGYFVLIIIFGLAIAKYRQVIVNIESIELLVIFVQYQMIC